MSIRTTMTILALCAAATGVAACGGDSGGSGGGDATLGDPKAVAIEIGGHKVTNGQIERRAMFLATAPTGPDPVTPPAKDSKEFKEFRVQAAELLRDEKIFGILAAACGKPCAVTTKQVEDQITEIRDQQFNGSDTSLLKGLADRGITRPDLFASLKASQQEQLLTAREEAKVVYTDAEGLAYYKANIAQYKLIAEKRLSHILVKTRAEALAIRAEATVDNFAQLARDKSTDPAAKADGGEDLGSISTGGLLPEIQAAAANLKDGQISQPVESQFGWHILLLRDIKARTKPYDEVKDEIRSQEIEVKRAAAIQNWRDTAVKKQQDRAKYLNDKIAPAKPATSTTSTSVTTPTATTTGTVTTTSTGTAPGPATP